MVLNQTHVTVTAWVSSVFQAIAQLQLIDFIGEQTALLIKVSFPLSSLHSHASDTSGNCAWMT